LLYENVDLATLDVAIEALIKEARPDPFFNARRAHGYGAAFRAGQIQILARAGPRNRRSGAGDPGPLEVPAGANDSCGASPSGPSNRLGQLFDPAYFLRRVQELGDLVEIPVVIDKTLIPSRDAVKDHPLPKLTAARRIVDWRNEFGRPVAGGALHAGADRPGIVETDAAGLWIGPVAGRWRRSAHRRARGADARGGSAARRHAAERPWCRHSRSSAT
jgi:hypothetical protein